MMAVTGNLEMTGGGQVLDRSRQTFRAGPGVPGFGEPDLGSGNRRYEVSFSGALRSAVGAENVLLREIVAVSGLPEQTEECAPVNPGLSLVPVSL